jgi:hypothetical protein
MMPKTYPTAEQILKDHTGVANPAADTSMPVGELPLLPLPGMEAEMMELFNTVSGRLPQTPGKVLQFMSTQEGEGTTTLCRAFASVVTVRLKKSVLFIESPAVMPSSDPADASLASALYSPRMHELLQHLRHHYDFVIIDAAAATASSNGFALARHVDGVILVVEAEYTRWPVVQNFKDRLVGSGVNILGVVLNKRRYYIPSFLYKRI